MKSKTLMIVTAAIQQAIAGISQGIDVHNMHEYIELSVLSLVFSRWIAVD
jgi:hypothetical protein